MGINVAAAAGQSNITKFEVKSNYGKTVDMAKGVTMLQYYESVLDPTVRITATVVDTGYRNEASNSQQKTKGLQESEGENFTVGEKATIKFADGNQKEISLKMKIEYSNYIEHTQQSVYTFDLVSPEYTDDKKVSTRVIKSYQGKISDSVRKILLENIKTQKRLFIDNTLNDLNFIGLTETPFYKLRWLAKRSVPQGPGAKGKLAGYFFYETSDGYKFKSIDKLFMEFHKKKLIFNNTTTDIPEGYDGKILNYSYDGSLNLSNILATGSLMETQVKAYNPFKNEYRQGEFNHKQQFQVVNTGGKEAPLVGDTGPTRIMVDNDDVGMNPTGKSLGQQLPKSKEVNFNIDEILRQSAMRYNQLFLIKLSITIPADFNLHAGDLLFCDFPEISSEQAAKEISKKKSGIYMIADICHRITGDGAYSQINLVRDSIMRKVPPPPPPPPPQRGPTGRDELIQANINRARS